MNTPIEFMAQCIACLSSDVSNVKSNPELAKIYEELIQEQITEKLHENSYIFCGTCVTHLQSFNKFKDICKESWKKLANQFTDEWACELEQLLCGSPIGEKPIICSIIEEDEIFLVDSDSEVSTIPPESDVEDEKVALPTAEDEILFIDVLEVEKSVLKEVEIPEIAENNNKDVEKEEEKSKEEGQKKERFSLVSLGLLPPATNNSLNICNVCHVSTKDIKEHYITAHTTVELDTFICSNCTIVHTSREKMIKHIKNYHTLYLKHRKCTYCELEFIESGEYRRHMVGHQIDKSTSVCNICGKLERNNSTLQFHINRVHNGHYSCKHCCKTFADSEEFYDHLKWEQTKREEKESLIFVCDICGYKTRYKQQLGYHVQNIHKIPKERDLPCENCDKKFSSSESLRHHAKFAHQKKYKCTECDLLFGFLKDMRYHYERDHTEGGSRVPCDVCGKVLSKKSMYLHKKTVHSDAKPFQCNVCDKAFKQKVMLKTHMYKHTGFRPFHCNICSKGFYDGPILERHFLREHGKKVTKDFINRECKNKAADDSHL